MSPIDIAGAITDAFCFRAVAKDFFNAYDSYETEAKLSYAKYNNICLAIESAAKALHADQGLHWTEIRDKFRHDLVRACNTEILASYGIVFSQEEEEALNEVNKIYSIKGFEYFLCDYAEGDADRRTRLHDLMTGNHPTPDLVKLESIYHKLISVDIKDGTLEATDIQIRVEESPKTDS